MHYDVSKNHILMTSGKIAALIKMEDFERKFCSSKSSLSFSFIEISVPYKAYVYSYFLFQGPEKGNGDIICQ